MNWIEISGTEYVRTLDSIPKSQSISEEVKEQIRSNTILETDIGYFTLGENGRITGHLSMIGAYNLELDNYKEVGKTSVELVNGDTFYYEGEIPQDGLEVNQQYIIDVERCSLLSLDNTERPYIVFDVVDIYDITESEGMSNIELLSKEIDGGFDIGENETQYVVQRYNTAPPYQKTTLSADTIEEMCREESLRVFVQIQ